MELQDRLFEQIRDVGVRYGDRLYVHTGLRATGLSRDEVALLLDAYRAVVGPEGAVYFPTHTYSFKGNFGSGPFHEDLPCHSSLGAWPELCRRHPEAHRSLHPTHSSGGIGTGVEAILAGHQNMEPVGFGSPLDKLYRARAKVLLVGCTLSSCTALHLAETHADVPYLTYTLLDVPPIALVQEEDGVVEVPIHEMPGCSAGFRQLEPMLREKNIIQDGLIAEAPTMCCDLTNLVDAAADYLIANPVGVLCTTSSCGHCSDWLNRLHKEGKVL